MTSLYPVLRDPRFLCSNDQAGSVHWRKEGGGNGNSKVSHTRFVRRSLTVVNYTNSPSYFPTILIMLMYWARATRNELSIDTLDRPGLLVYTFAEKTLPHGIQLKKRLMMELFTFICKLSILGNTPGSCSY